MKIKAGNIITDNFGGFPEVGLVLETTKSFYKILWSDGIIVEWEGSYCERFLRVVSKKEK